jgi:hypothetical protein
VPAEAAWVRQLVAAAPKPQFAYKVVATGFVNEDLQSVLDEHSRDGWRLVQTYEIMGYTRHLIFERIVLR